MISEVVITCCHERCGITFAVPSYWDEKRRQDHTRFFCPNGHGQSYNGETEAEKLRRERDRLAQRIAERDDTIRAERERREGVERQLSAQKGVTTRIKNRVGHGVCPCCTRSFANLAKHMKTKHSDFAASEATH